MARVATDVGVQQPDGEPSGSHIAKAECKIVPNVALRIADAVDDGASRVLGEYGHALPLPAEPVAQGRIGQPRLPAVERVVISVTDKRTDALLVQPLQPLDELPLGTQAALRAVVHVAGDKQRVYPFTDAQVDDVVVRPERRIGYLARDALRRGVAQPLESSFPLTYWDRLYTPFQTEADAAPVRLIVRRVKPTPGSQLAFFATYSYHGFITDRDGETLELEADHRRHAEIENAIRDLKYGVGLNHLPSGRFAANAAWLAVQVMAHNLARWTARIGLGERIVTTKTLRRRVFALAGRLTLHLPQHWPWETQFSRALARLRAIPLPT